MAWTTPITWTAGQVVDEDDLNEQIRDNMNFLNTAVGDAGLNPFLLMGS
mgnify:CR=1 FL=1